MQNYNQTVFDSNSNPPLPPPPPPPPHPLQKLDYSIHLNIIEHIE